MSGSIAAEGQRPRSAAGIAADRLIAYFSMEMALEDRIPTYSGGLGVLAGDALRSAADLGLAIVGVTLAHRQGHFRQRLDAQGAQREVPAAWSPEAVLRPLRARVSVPIDGRTVWIRAWCYDVHGRLGTVPVYLLDTALPENAPEDRAITDLLYGGDQRNRLKQEVVLGIGGVAMLRALGMRPDVYHMNEGHAALLTLALLRELAGDREAVRSRCVFTTHTPVPAGHDRFPGPLVREVVGPAVDVVDPGLWTPEGDLDLTFLALSLSRYVNGVAMRHGQISRDLYPGYPIASITNGVHAVTWASPAMARLFDREIPHWRADNLYLRYAIRLALDDVRAAHEESKAALLDEVRRRTGVALDPRALTLGFARRATAYKRADLLFTDLARLRRIARAHGPMQVVYAGKAHPADEGGKALIRRVVAAASALAGDLSVVYLEDYDLALARALTSGADVWLNTPQKPLEASGTSGMKAALNGVPSLSVLDGWWVEGCIEGVTGWAIGDESPTSDVAADAASLYDKLEGVVLPLFHGDPDGFGRVMRAAIALNSSFFNTQRMMFQYAMNAYAAPRVEARADAAATAS